MTSMKRRPGLPPLRGGIKGGVNPRAGRSTTVIFDTGSRPPNPLVLSPEAERSADAEIGVIAFAPVGNEAQCIAISQDELAIQRVSR